MTWRRTRNWDKKYHKNNPKPPTLQTINKELADFKGFFDWANDQGWVTSGIEYPFQKIDWSKSVEKNPAFELEHWIELVYYLRTWTKKKVNSKGNELKNPFTDRCSRSTSRSLGTHNAPSRTLKLRWGDIQFKERVEVFSKGKEKERKRIIAYIQISHETKTGRRLVISRAGEYLKRLKELYRDKCGRRMGDEEFVFQNVGTIHSRADHLLPNHFRIIFFGSCGTTSFMNLKLINKPVSRSPIPSTPVVHFRSTNYWNKEFHLRLLVIWSDTPSKPWRSSTRTFRSRTWNRTTFKSDAKNSVLQTFNSWKSTDLWFSLSKQGNQDPSSRLSIPVPRVGVSSNQHLHRGSRSSFVSSPQVRGMMGVSVPCLQVG